MITELMIKIHLKNPELPTELFEDGEQFKRTLESFPDYSMKLFQSLLSNKQHFKRVIASIQQLAKIARSYTDISELQNYLAPRLEDIACLTNSYEDFLWIRCYFPKFADVVFNHICERSDHLAKLLDSPGSIKSLKLAYPEKADFLLSEVLNDKNRLIGFVNSSMRLCSISDTFPTHADFFFYFAILNDEIIKDVIKDKLDLKIFRKFLPKYAYLFKTTIEEARVNAIREANKLQIVSCSKAFAQLNYLNKHIFPPEIQAVILDSMGDRTLLTQEEVTSLHRRHSIFFPKLDSKISEPLEVNDDNCFSTP